ncbi:MAG TPA: ABC transporter permease, partial [Chthoniobacteraceae bacterium]|nr:ABC transporter permease [Chthoniobacteraceae bacterium]
LIGGIGLFVVLAMIASRNPRWQRAWKRLRADRVGIAAACVIALYLLVGALEGLRFPQSGGGVMSVLELLFRRVPAEKTYSAPFATTTLSVANPEPLRGWHVLGTDALGKDTLVETLRACHTALLIGGLTSAIYIPVGALLGILAGYFRRRVDDAIQYLYSVIIAIPDVLLLASIILVIGKGVLTMAIALSITSWIGLCRLIRGETLRQAERPYVAAARALGQSHWNIITRHILPNVMHLVIINFILGFSYLVIIESVLSYLSVGVPIGTPSWGIMIDGARGELSRTPVVWWNLTAATTAMFLLVLSLNLFGNALRRAFDPKAGSRIA